MSKELLPCPFCGNGCTRDVWYVLGMPKECVKCGARGPMVSDVATWGQRTDYFASLRATNECLRLQRENEKYRRKVAALKYQLKDERREANIYAERPRKKYKYKFRMAVDFYMRGWRGANARKILTHWMYRARYIEGDGLLKFLKWQDEFEMEVRK